MKKASFLALCLGLALATKLSMITFVPIVALAGLIYAWRSSAAQQGRNGALLADVPHTRPVQITGIAGDQALVERLGFSQTRYEGPTGIVGVLHDACRREGLPCASLCRTGRQGVLALIDGDVCGGAGWACG